MFEEDPTAPVFWDTETCGFHGMPVLLQYAHGDRDPVVYDLWYEPCDKTLALIDAMVNHEGGNVLFNAVFDLFQIIKLHTTLTTLRGILGEDFIPLDYIDLMGVCEERARFAPYTLKFKKIVDLMLVAQQGPYQSMMDRKDIRIKRIPTILAPHVAKYLEETIPMSQALFARFKEKKERWAVYIDEDDPEFADVVCKFAPSKGLKVIAVDAGLVDADEVTKYEDVKFDEHPVEYGWAPYAKAGVIKEGYLLETGPGNWWGTWPDRIAAHCATWKYNQIARKYAYDDPILTRGVWEFLGKPEMNDTNSVLANLVASCRWRGFAVDTDKVKELRKDAVRRSNLAPKDPNSVKRYVFEHLTDAQKLVISGESTKKVILEEAANFEGSVGERAREVLKARAAAKEVELFDKLIQAKRFHASFKIIGTLSDRMAGADGLNAQGIKASKEVRDCFPVADGSFVFCGGDFDAFEVSIAEAVYKDPALRKALTEPVECYRCFGTDDKCKTCKGKGEVLLKIHAFFAQALYPDKTLTQIEDSKGTDKDMYLDGKKGIFLSMYGGNENTMVERIGVSEEVAIEAFARFEQMFPGVKAFRESITRDYCSMTQPGGIGTKVVWQDPKPFVESLFGFKRFFTLENQITKALFQLAENPPKSWLDVKVKVVRRDRVQTAGNAVRSALFAAAFGVQGKCLRAASNHLIQSPGAHITKELQSRLWGLQPTGISPWKVMLFNVHDEVNGCFTADVMGEAEQIVKQTVKEFEEQIPLIKMEWKQNLKSWAEK